MSHTELFTTRHISPMQYTAVIFDHDTASFHHALFECICAGGGMGYALKEKGTAIDADTAGRLSYASDESRREITTVSGRPIGEIKLIRALASEKVQQNAAFSFEKKLITTDLVEAEKVPYIRVVRYDCSAEGNGRPVYMLREDYYEIHDKLVDFLTPENWRTLVMKPAAWHFAASGEGVLY